MDYSPPGSSVHGILQARILEWVACSSPRDLLDPGIKLVSPASPVVLADSVLESLTLWLHSGKFHIGKVG